MRLEEASRRKRAIPDDEGGRPDVAMEVAARNPIRPVQYGGSSSSWEVRPEPSRRRDAEEQLGGDVARARLQEPQGVVLTAGEARLQPREELEAAVESICKHAKELGALHVAESDVGEMFLPGRSAKLVSAFSELPGAVVDLRYGWDLASAAGRQECWKTLHAERPELVIGSPPGRRHSPWIKDERKARLQGIKHLNFCCAVYRWHTQRGVHFLHEHPWESFLVGEGLLEGSKRAAWCCRGAMRSALVWPGRALAFEERWLGGTSIVSADRLGDIHD